MSSRFTKEAQDRIREIPNIGVKSYVLRTLDTLTNEVLTKPDSPQKAEDCLTYSIILRNYGITNLHN